MAELREQYPQYNNRSDAEIVSAFKEKYYPDASMAQIADAMEVRPQDEGGFWNTVRSPFRYDTFKQFMGGAAKGLIAEESLAAEASKVLTGRTDKQARSTKEQIFGDPVSRKMFEIAEVMDEIEAAEGTDSPLYKEWAAEYDRLAAQSEEKPAKFSLKQFKEAVAADPGAMGAEVVNAIMADPYLALTPLGWEKAAAAAAKTVLRSGKAAIRAGQTTARAVRTDVATARVLAGTAGAGAAGAGIVAPISLFEQLNETGEVDEKQLLLEAGIGAVASAGIGAAMASKGVFRAIAKKRGTTAKKVKENFEAEDDIAGAVRNYYDEAGMVPDESVVKLLPAPEAGRVVRVGEGGTARLSTAAEDAAAVAARNARAAAVIDRAVAESRIGPDIAAVADGLNLPPVVVAETVRRVPPSRRLPAPESVEPKLLTADMGDVIEVAPTGTARRLTRIESERPPMAGVDESRFGAEAARFRERQGISGTRQLSREEYAVMQKAQESMPRPREPERIRTDLTPDNIALSGRVRSMPGVKPQTVVSKLTAAEKKTLRREFPAEKNDAARVEAVRARPKWGKQQGEIQPATLAALVAGAGGGLVGYSWSEGRISGALTGAALGLGAFSAARALPKMFRSVAKASDEPPPIRIGHLGDDAEEALVAGHRASWQLSETIREAVPDQARREAITHFLEGRAVKLTDAEKQVAKQVRAFLDRNWTSAKADGVIEGFIEDYVPHLWRRGTRSKSDLMNALHDKPHGAGRSPKTLHGKKRIIPSYEEGIRQGLEPVTLDIADLVKLYADNVNRARVNKRLIRALRNEMGPEGKLIQPAGKAPSGYVTINHPSLMGSAVHPDIAASWKLLFDASDPGVVMRGLTALNFAAKRSLVSMSLFHQNALLESMIYAAGHPIGAIKLMRGTHPILEMLRHGKAGDTVDVALRAGLKIGSIEDVGSDVFYATLRDIESWANKQVPGLGKIPKGVEKANRFVDKIMWDRFHPGVKLLVFQKEYEKALLKNAKLKNANGKYPLRSEKEIAEGIAEYVNDAFGGLNWRRIAEKTRTKLGREVMLSVHSPGGRRVAQIGLFAPDWTVANLRVLRKALPFGARTKAIANMHRRYAVKASMFYLTAGNALNYLLSGHFIWDNEDISAIDMGDGRKMTFSKQFVEPYHWITQPGKTALNKLGILPRMTFELALNKRWLSPRGRAPELWEEDASVPEIALAATRHAGSKFVPIAGQQIEAQGAVGLWGFVGHPVYGTKDKPDAGRGSTRGRYDR